MKLTKRDAQELAFDGCVGGLTMITEYGHGPRRWTETTTVIFSDEAGDLWAFNYEKGLTENQETEIDDTEAYRVQAVHKPVTVTTYERLP